MTRRDRCTRCGTKASNFCSASFSLRQDSQDTVTGAGAASTHNGEVATDTDGKENAARNAFYDLDSCSE